MGREIRRVPATWEHPRQDCHHSPWSGGCEDAKRNGGMCFKPLYDREYEEDAKEWLQACIDWANGKIPEHSSEATREEYQFYWDYAGNPPDKDSYRPTFTEEPTHYQVYETVSEGTPVTPVFATKDELTDYLIAHGDFWDRGRGWERQATEEFVRDESAPTMVAHRTAQGLTISTPGHTG